MNLTNFYYQYLRPDRLAFGLFVLVSPIYLYYFQKSYWRSAEEWLVNDSQILYKELIFQQQLGFGMLFLLLLATLLATQHKNKLQEEKNYFLNALDQAALSIAILDAQQKIKWTNNIFEEWNGKEKVLNQNFIDLTTNRPAAVKAFAQLTNPDIWKADYQSQTLKGKAVKTTINKLKAPKGTFVVMDADITNLIKANHYQKLFFSTIGHDTQSTIRESMEKVNALYEDYQEDSLLKQRLGALMEHIKQTHDLTKNLVDWSELSIKRTNPVASSYTHFDKELTAVQNRYKEFFQQHQIDFVKDFDPSLSFYIDPDMLRAILRNLIINAIESIEALLNWEQQKRSCIKITAHKDQSTYWTMIKISDNGEGVAANLAEQLFKPPANGEEIKLGTMLCREFVYAHNGTIYLDQPEKGYTTAVTFTIPPKKKQIENA